MWKKIKIYRKRLGKQKCLKEYGMKKKIASQEERMEMKV
jgi:hypothetical protein